jgi:hypothetical protein
VERRVTGTAARLAEARVGRSAQVCQRLIQDETYRVNLEQRWRAGTLPPAIEVMLWSYAIGRPQQSIELTSHGISLAAIIAGRVEAEAEAEDAERDRQPGWPPATRE